MRSPFLTLLLCATALASSGCGLLIAETSTQVVARIDEATASQPIEPQVTPEPQAIAPVESEPDVPTVTVTRYKIDSQCNALVPEDVDVPAVAPLDETISKIVGDRSNGDFRIAGYRINIEESTKAATLDFRLPVDTARSIYSLSNCEQFALLGELRETLIANAEWDIDSVNFQVQGQDLQY
ncbi:hypothetical protein Lepto7376_1187 [[Leptolyngbya] sp. PCC 7376]|uniref:hypothetical protein n=1 Tax=[Leptolyngbya] sp. PCC 7376 TaxID=111781 RepID=UPI00029F468F|nr:hypothetical protein [[Leptolyngbya] sp. PCC 7376]AFY37544.1 hypothetical protein Lepto7376_1187 [[Leptolyngbya] sp. PCC 7376]